LIGKIKVQQQNTL